VVLHLKSMCVLRCLHYCVGNITTENLSTRETSTFEQLYPGNIVLMLFSTLYNCFFWSRALRQMRQWLIACSLSIPMSAAIWSS